MLQLSKRENECFLILYFQNIGKISPIVQLYLVTIIGCKNILAPVKGSWLLSKGSNYFTLYLFFENEEKRKPFLLLEFVILMR